MNSHESLQRADPLGALAGRRLTIAAASAVIVFAILLTWVTADTVTNWPSAVSAVCLAIVAASLLIVRTSIRLGPLNRSWAIAVIVFGLAAHFASAAATWQSPVLHDQWGPYVLALLLLALVPYRPIRDIVVLTAVTAAWVVVITHAQEITNDLPGIPGLRVLTAVTPVLALPLGGAVFAQSVLTFLDRWRESALTTTDEESRRQEVAITRAVQQTRVSILNRDVVPFYSDVLGRDRIDDGDPERAGQLAGSIRAVMLADNDRTWMDELVTPQTALDPSSVSPSNVRDVHRMARHMNLDQRAAVRAIIAAIREAPGGSERSITVAVHPFDAVLLCEAVVTASGGRDRHGQSVALRPYFALMSTVFTDFSYEINTDKLTMRFCYERP